MAILYRPHRGGLRAAMNEVAAFDTEDELKEHVRQHWEDLYPKCQVIFGRTDKDVDERIGWLTTYILVQRYPEEEDTFCAGMCDLDTYVEFSKEDALVFTKKIYQLWDEEDKEPYTVKKKYILTGYYKREDKEGFPVLKSNNKEYTTLLLQSVYTSLVHKGKLFFYEDEPYCDIQLKECGV